MDPRHVTEKRLSKTWWREMELNYWDVYHSISKNILNMFVCILVTCMLIDILWNYKKRACGQINLETLSLGQVKEDSFL